MKKPFLAVALLFVSAFVLINSCGKKDVSRSVNNDKVHKEVLGQIEGYDFTIIADQYNSTSNYYLSVSNSLNNAAFHSLVTYVKANVNDSSINPICLIFYTTDTNAKHFLDNSYNGLKAVAVYEYASGALTHRLFISNGSMFIEDSNNRKTVGGLSFYDVEFALLHDVKDQYSNVAAYHMFVDYHAAISGAAYDVLPLHEAYYYYLANQNNSSVNIDITRVSHTYVLNSGCYHPCDADANSPGCIMLGDGTHGDDYTCGGVPPRRCQVENYSTTSVSIGLLSANDAQTYFDTSLAYKLRDSLLGNSNFGRKYVNYYYALSGILTVGDYSNMCAEMVNIMPSINTAVTKVLNPNTYGNSVLIDNTFANNLTTVINDMENLHGDGNYKAILENVKLDIQTIKGMTVNQFRTAYF